MLGKTNASAGGGSRVEAYDLSMYDIYGTPINQTTANCYIVKTAGVYCFPLIYGNAIKDGMINMASFTNIGGSYSLDFVAHDGTVITTSNIEDLVGVAAEAQLSIADTDGVFANIRIINKSPCRYVQFEIVAVPNTGANGIISVKNSDGTIMWNWHIWVWNEDLTSVEITNETGASYKILPYNIGSKWDNFKTTIKNWHYQYGRPVPLICPSTFDSEDDHVSYGVLSLMNSAVADNIQMGIQNPTTFYNDSESSGRNSRGNWFYENSYNNKGWNLWDAACTSSGSSDNVVVKTVYDPSPIGFKMPNGNTFTGFSIISRVDDNGVMKVTRYSGDTTGLSIYATGCREAGGVLENAGTHGYFWTAAKSNSSYYWIAAQFYDNYFSGTSSFYRYRALSVRPVEE